MSDRLFSEKYTKTEVEETSELAKKMEAMQQLKTDLVPVAARPPTRMERKFNRIFGSAGETSQTFVTGFKLGALVGGTFGGILGTY